MARAAVADDGATIGAMPRVRRPLPALILALLASLGGASACSAAKDGDGGGTLHDAGATDAPSFDLGVIDDGGLVVDAADDGGTPVGLETAIYAHSSTTLYKLDPLTRVVTKIGDFVDAKGAAVTQMTDLALDKVGTMYGVTFDALYRIDYAKPKPVCTKLATLSQEFNGLTFVPEGMIDAGKEVLIGVANSGDWYRVDVAAGATSATLTKLGAYGGSYQWAGDTVGIIDDKVYATVTTGALGGNNHVVVVDPKTGKVTKDLGDCGAGSLYGVGYWGGTLYGFSSTGELFSIDLGTGKGTKVPITGGPTSWWGAGVRTSAPRIQ
jgi:hypothetical protein